MRETFQHTEMAFFVITMSSKNAFPFLGSASEDSILSGVGFVATLRARQTVQLPGLSSDMFAEPEFFISRAELLCFLLESSCSHF